MTQPPAYCAQCGEPIYPHTARCPRCGLGLTPPSPAAAAYMGSPIAQASQSEQPTTFKGVLLAILRTLLGIVLVLYAVVIPLLGVIGEQAPGQITHVRKQMGEDEDGTGRYYTWAISYEFEADDRVVSGFTYRRGDYGRPNRYPSSTIRYLAPLPQINVPADEARPTILHVVLLGAGLLMIWPGLLRRKQAAR